MAMIVVPPYGVRESCFPRINTSSFLLTSSPPLRIPSSPSRIRPRLHISCRTPTNRSLRNARLPSPHFGVWRFLNLEIPADEDPGKDDYSISDPVLQAIASLTGFPKSSIPMNALSIVRKSFDARKVVNRVKNADIPKFIYTVDLNLEKVDMSSIELQRFCHHLHKKPGKIDYLKNVVDSVDVSAFIKDFKSADMEHLSINAAKGNSDLGRKFHNLPKVTVVGSGPAGLFAALALAECGANVTLLERGQPVERRGYDIGGLMVRRLLQPDSNFCFGEGGAGTWSDGKLTTRIGKNGKSVRTVLATLIKFGASPHILINGKPHLGTDKLVHILRQFRAHLQYLGVDIRFGTKMVDLIVKGTGVSGVKITKDGGCLHLNPEELLSDAVVLAVGHSARDIYSKLLEHNIKLTPKDFAVGFRVEHPQDLINEIQYRKWASEVRNGYGKIPVADYKVATNIGQDCRWNSDKNEQSSCYSFCMCPGGQIVPTSTNTAELCINGMSFSKRSSKWANAALVLMVSPLDLQPFSSEHGVLAGVAFQKLLEEKAAVMGGGEFVVPAQVLPDFLDNRVSGTSLPSSSYRLGVREATLHNLFSENHTEMFKTAIMNFNKQIPGFIDRRALLHAVETRTSAPVRIERNRETFECISASGLYPVGEGAGYAGGIISAAVDGLNAGLALAEQLGLYKDVFRKWQAAERLEHY